MSRYEEEGYNRSFLYHGDQRLKTLIRAMQHTMMTTSSSSSGNTSTINELPIDGRVNVPIVKIPRDLLTPGAVRLQIAAKQFAIAGASCCECFDFCLKGMELFTLLMVSQEQIQAKIK